MRLVEFYEGLGFRETFRTPEDGVPIHVEVSLDGFTIGIADADSARADHGLRPSLDGRPVEILLWTDDADRDYARLTAEGGAVAQPAARLVVEPPPRLGRGPGRQPDPVGAAPPIEPCASARPWRGRTSARPRSRRPSR